MTAFDLVVIVFVALSALFALARGLVREVVGLVALLVGFVAAFVFTPALGDAFAAWSDHPFLRYVVAFALIVIAAIVIGAVIAGLLAKAIRAVGLGFVDHLLGAVYGLLRGLAFVVAFVLVAGLTALPRADWWQNAVLAPFLVEAALQVKPWLPRAWADRLDYSRSGPTPAQQKA